jgi:hypothetical protein
VPRTTKIPAATGIQKLLDVNSDARLLFIAASTEPVSQQFHGRVVGNKESILSDFVDQGRYEMGRRVLGLFPWLSRQPRRPLLMAVVTFPMNEAALVTSVKSINDAHRFLREAAANPMSKRLCVLS